MRRRIAWFLAIFSALYLLTIGILPDPIPFIDEGIALLIFVKATAYLGYDVTRWLPVFGRGKDLRKTVPERAGGRTVDV